ncbi:MAG: choline dehydrogenase [Mucilaginibacter sp.]|nr:choline dehydrogenase [Mucilaginibacter sp.]
MIWDYIVIGAGSAGCALAYELARSGPQKTVLVLEAGGWDRSPFIKIPAGQPRASAKHDWGYRSQPDATRNGASENWKRGRVLGGSSSINGMIYVRGAAEDFDRWSERCGNVGGWSAREIIPIFREFETSDQNGPLRGRAGPQYVTTVRHPHAITEAFVKSACAAGRSFNEDYNGRSQEGVSYLQRSQRKGLRCSAADAFLRPLLSSSNLKLLVNALVEKIEVVNGRAVAVSFLYKGKQRREMARDIILCAGVINSPKLLMLSGIGDAQELNRHNIAVVLDRPEVGRNLKDHPLMRLVYRSKIPTYNLTEGLLQKLSIVAKFIRYREGPISAGFESTAFLKTDPSEPVPDIQLYFAPIGYVGKMGGTGGFTPYPAFMTCIAKTHPVSSGCIRLASNDPNDSPLIECRLLADQADVDTLVRGIETVRGIMKRDPIASLIEAEITPGAAVGNEEAMREFVRAHAEVSLHPNGTCRMGVDAGAVVGPDLRVRGTDNLWIADASIMPDHISANLNAVCMMIGIKLGKQLVASR